MINRKTKTHRSGKRGVLLEDLDSKLNIVVEGQRGLGKQIEKIEGGLGKFRDEVGYKFDVVFDELRLTRNEVKEKIGRDEFSVIEKRIAHIEKVMRI